MPVEVHTKVIRANAAHYKHSAEQWSVVELCDAIDALRAENRRLRDLLAENSAAMSDLYAAECRAKERERAARVEELRWVLDEIERSGAFSYADYIARMTRARLSELASGAEAEFESAGTSEGK